MSIAEILFAYAVLVIHGNNAEVVQNFQAVNENFRIAAKGQAVQFSIKVDTDTVTQLERCGLDISGV